MPALAPRDGDSTFMPAEFIIVSVALDWLRGRRHDRRATRHSIFPVAPRMFLGLTDRRLLIWSARRGWRMGRFLGFVTLDRIVDAAAPTIGTGWRSVDIHLANEPKVRLRVPSQFADEFSRALKD